MPRYIAITDIHGELGKLESLLSKLETREDDITVFMGDYIDRGSKSKEGSNIIDFEVSVKGDETVVEEVDGLEFLTLDEPETPFELDTPPSVKQKEVSNG